MTPSRPVLRYLGGKWRLAPWIISHFPAHRLYVEPFGGAASVLLRKPRSMGECYNDIDGEVVNLFRVLRDETGAAELRRLIELTPFSREEYDEAFQPADAPVERARKLIVRSYMGHGSSSAVSRKSTGFRASMVNRGGALPAGEWPTLPAALHAVTDRLKGVLIENRSAFQVIDRYDEDEALIYLDPPYVPDTRSQKRKGGQAYHAYKHELTDEEHTQLLDRIIECRAAVVLSGYPSETYDGRLSSWERVEIAAHADGALDRTEVLWINPQCISRLNAEKHPSLFEGAA
ncbi:DNA adenine methylase [Neorhizobium galegae]|uniref:DNA adenine methylase n=1 Tax=Neorhizobium galegae TaxID=399 RepID=UPI002781FE08|nr:DNA adenine methylase [Neorhizobium galegae]MDQ0132622.1 DNA adenine methylase [Neorhizobium galegae]